MSTAPTSINAKVIHSPAHRVCWNAYFMQLAYLVAERSTCLRRKVGAIAVLDKRILSTGYNGAPAGLKHCAQTGCLRDQMNIPSGERHELCRVALALLAWGFGFGLIGIAFALTSFVLGIVGIVKGRTVYGIIIIIGSVCLPVIGLMCSVLNFMQ